MQVNGEGRMRDHASDHVRTIASYFRAFYPAPDWDDLPSWPPDVFALSNLVLDHTQSYRFVVSPPAGGRWPPIDGWNDEILSAAAAWREAGDEPGAPLPRLVEECWEVVTKARDVALADVASGEAWEVCQALLTLHAVADEACAWLAAPAAPGACRACEERAWKLLDRNGSLSRISPARIRILPKGHFTAKGITIRSLSRYLALCYESVDVHWSRVGPDEGVAAALQGREDYNILLVP